MTALNDTASLGAFGLSAGPQSPKSVPNLSFTGVAQIAPPGDTTRASYLSTAEGQLYVGYKALGPPFKGGIDILDASDPTNILDVSSLGSDFLDVQEVIYNEGEGGLYVAAALKDDAVSVDLGTPSSLIKVTNLSNPQTTVAGLTGDVGKSVVNAPAGDGEHDVYVATDGTSLFRFDAGLSNKLRQQVQGAEFRSVATTQNTVFTVDRGAKVYSSSVGANSSFTEEQTIASGVGELAIGRLQARNKAVLDGSRLFLALGSEGLAVLDAASGKVLFRKSDTYYTSVSLHRDAAGVSEQPSDLVYASRLDGTIDLFRIGPNGIDAGGTNTGLNEFGSLDLNAFSGVNTNEEQVNYVLAAGCHVYVANSQNGVVVLQIGNGDSCPIEDENQAPTVNDDSDDTIQDQPTTTDVLANDTDPDGSLDPSTVQVQNGPSNGTTTVNNDGSVTYEPDPGFTGTDTYHYTVKDGDGAESETATVTITVNEAGNQAPQVNGETDNTNEGQSTTTDVLANDTDPDGSLDPSTVTVQTPPDSGTVNVNSDGTITYTPDPGFDGDGSYRYTVKDNDGAESDVARVTIKINAAPTVDNPDPPSGECFAVAANGQTTITTANLSASDPDDEPKDLTFTVTSAPTQGTLLLNGNQTSSFTQKNIENGNLEYSHTASSTSDDSFTFNVKDSDGAGPEGVSCNIMVDEANQSPSAADDSDQTTEDQPTTTDVLANDSDPDGSLNPSTVTVQSGPSDGTTTVNNDGSVTYTPDSGFTGQDTYTYTVDDNDGAPSNEATVTITVNEANQPPTVDKPDPPSGECFAVTAGSQTTITTSDLRASDPDDGPADLTFTVTSGPTQGELLLNGSPTSSFTQQDIADGNLEYNHTAQNAADDSFTFNLKDPDGAGPEGVPCNITVNPGNQPPTATADSDTTDEDQSTTTDVLANDSDPDGTLDASTVQVTSGPSNGTATVNNDGTITYTPDTDFTGDDTYTYTVTDGDGAKSNEATVTVTVEASTAATAGCPGAIGGGVAFTNNGNLKTVSSDGGTVNELLITGPNTSILALGTGVDIDNDGNVGVVYVQESEGAEQSVNLLDKDDATPATYALPVAAKSSKTLIGVGSFGGDPSFFYVGAVGNGDKIFRVNFDDGSSDLLANPANGVDAILGVADVDGDSDNELVFADGSQQTRYINPSEPPQATFTKLPNGGAGSNNNIGIGSCLADIDGDGKASIPIVDGSNEIDFVDADGISKTIVTGDANEEAAKTPLAFADVDNDGKPELVYLENNNSPAELKYVDDLGDQNFGPSNFKFLENQGGGTIEADTGTGAVSAQ